MVSPFVLAGVALDSHVTNLIYGTVRSIKPDFPHDCCALCLSLFLKFQGFQIKQEISAQNLADSLELSGWIKVKDLQPIPGDIAVCEDLNSNGMSDHIFLVVAPALNNMVWAWDNRLGANSNRVYLRNINHSPPGYTPVWYFLRHQAEKTG